MLLKVKKHIKQIFVIIPFILIGFGVNAQGQYLNKVYSDARNYYFNGQYQYVYQTLGPHIEAMKNPDNEKYYKRTQDGVGMVFRVYKMIIESEYKLNQIERAEWFENWVINYFRNIYSPDDVLDYIDYANL